MTRLPELRLIRSVVMFAGLAGILLVLWATLSNDFYLRIAIISGLFVIIVVPLDLMIGYTGYLSFGQAAFYGAGAYIIGNLTTLRFGVNYWIAFLVAIVILAMVAYVLTFPLFRLAGVHFAIGTLALGQLAYIAFQSWEWWTGGVFGTNGIFRPSIGGLTFDSNSRYFLLVSLFVSWLTVQGPTGLALRAIRQDEVLAQARGLNVVRYKRLVFVIAGVFAGIAGALFAPLQIAIDPSSFTVTHSMLFVAMAILGGIGTLIGPALGATAYVCLDQLVQSFGKWNQVVMGGLLVIVVLFFRWGIWGAVDRIIRFGLRQLMNRVGVAGLTSARKQPAR